MSNITLTALEFAVLRAIDASEFGAELTDAVPSFTITDNLETSSPVAGRTVSGLVASLYKKGMLACTGEGRDAMVALTDAGAEKYVSVVGALQVRKKIRSAADCGTANCNRCTLANGDRIAAMGMLGRVEYIGAAKVHVRYDDGSTQWLYPSQINPVSK